MPTPLNRRKFLTLASGVTACAAGLDLESLWAQPAGNASAGDGTPESELAGPPGGPWRRLFLDGAVIEQQQGLSRVFHAPARHPANPVLRADKPWETAPSASGPYVYGTAMRNGEKLRLWYQVLNHGNHVGYAESGDGIRWSKPELGLIEFNGSTANNLVVSAAHPDATGGECHNPSVIRRPGNTDPATQFALYGFDNKAGHARVAFSPDGLHWKYAPDTRKQGLFASSDVVNFFYDPFQKRYAATWKTRNRRGRAAGVAWSANGLAWTKPLDGPVFVADDLDPDATQIYGMPVFPYQGLYIGLPWVYHARYFRYGEYSVEKLHEAQADSRRTVDVELAWSWDLINWTRPSERRPFLALGARGQWDCGMIYTARAPVVMDDKLFFYYGGFDEPHDQKMRGAIGLAVLRVDGFCSMGSGDGQGWLITRREAFREPVVTINARTTGAGSVSAEILDRHNRTLPGFSREDCLPFAGDAIAHRLKWKTSRLPTGQKAADYKLRFWLKQAELFSYLPDGLDPAQPDLTRVPAM